MTDLHLEDYESSLPPEERAKHIEEAKRWIKYRYSGKWFEKVALSLLLEMEELKKNKEKINTCASLSQNSV